MVYSSWSKSLVDSQKNSSKFWLNSLSSNIANGKGPRKTEAENKFRGSKIGDKGMW